MALRSSLALALSLALASCLGTTLARPGPRRRPAEVEQAVQRADAAHRRLWEHFNGTGGAEGEGAAPASEAAKDGSGTGCIRKQWLDFTGGKQNPGFVVETGRVHADQEGWLMDCENMANTRVYYNYDSFNSYDHPTTHILVWFRGAPQLGKNSNVYLIEPGLNGIQDGWHDEIDLVEMYGTGNKSEANIYKAGRQVGPFGYQATDPGHKDYLYELYLERGKYLRFQSMKPTGGPKPGKVIVTKELWGANVPDRALRLYSGIWDCSIFPLLCPGPTYLGKSQMCLKGIYIDNC